MNLPIHDLAVKFCRENNFQPVTLIEKAMTVAVYEAQGEFLKTIKDLREGLQKNREENNRDNRRLV